jgi:hypothetical protein
VSINDIDLAISGEAVQEYANAADRNLTAPAGKEENHTFNPGKEAGLGTWTEAVKIRDTDLLPTKNAPEDPSKFNFVALLEVLGPGDGGFPTNAGRVHNQYWYMDKAGLASSDPKTCGPYKRRIATVNSMLSACGIDTTGGVTSYKALLAGDKPLVGQSMAAVFRKYKYKNKQTGEVVTAIDIDGFIPLG